MAEQLTDRRAMQLACVVKAVAMWKAFDDNQKTGVRFGLFPAGPMREAEKEGYAGKELAVALMDCAKFDGGMRA